MSTFTMAVLSVTVMCIPSVLHIHKSQPNKRTACLNLQPNIVQLPGSLYLHQHKSVETNKIK